MWGAVNSVLWASVVLCVFALILLRSLCFLLLKSVFIGVHPWLNSFRERSPVATAPLLEHEPDSRQRHHARKSRLLTPPSNGLPLSIARPDSNSTRSRVEAPSQDGINAPPSTLCPRPSALAPRPSSFAPTSCCRNTRPRSLFTVASGIGIRVARIARHRRTVGSDMRCQDLRKVARCWARKPKSGRIAS
jgi:hypothetical protein